MKRIVSLLLAVVMAFLLVGCANENIGDFMKEYGDYKPTVIPELTLHLYVIGGTIDKDPRDTVERMVSQYTKEKFNTNIEIEYLDETGYKEALQLAIEDQDKTLDIVLVNDQAMLLELANEGKILSLQSFFDSKKYGLLNTKIASTLLEASSLQEYLHIHINNAKKLGTEYSSVDKLLAVKDSDKLNLLRQTLAAYNKANPNATLKESDVFTVEVRLPEDAAPTAAQGYVCNTMSTVSQYSVPNNRLIGEYEYLLVNKEKAKYYNFSATKVAGWESLADAAELTALLGAEAEANVYTVKGAYPKKAEFEANGYYCNVIAYPTITSEEAFRSAFAIMSDTPDAERAMQVLFAINTDTYLRNLLQYGVKNTHYTEENGVATPITTEGSRYQMNPLYTGDMFAAYYCSDPSYNWTKEMGEYALKQNNESVVG